jgi:hypothetical protein
MIPYFQVSSLPIGPLVLRPFGILTLGHYSSLLVLATAVGLLVFMRRTAVLAGPRPRA